MPSIELNKRIESIGHYSVGTWDEVGEEKSRYYIHIIDNDAPETSLKPQWYANKNYRDHRVFEFRLFVNRAVEDSQEVVRLSDLGRLIRFLKSQGVKFLNVKTAEFLDEESLFEMAYAYAQTHKPTGE